MLARHDMIDGKARALNLGIEQQTVLPIGPIYDLGDHFPARGVGHRIFTRIRANTQVGDSADGEALIVI